ncbi:MAG: M48 family metallopeptidase [Alphaproteobacteria bacterium]|nr:MAG: M48 family metallopeptidase [Alphaproteobacteria bacterium]
MRGAGRLFDGKSAKARDIALILDEDRFRIESPDCVLVRDGWCDDLRNENKNRRSANLLLSVAPDDPLRIELTDPVFVAEVKAYCPRLEARRAAPSGWWKPYFFWIGGAAASVLLIYFFVLPMLVSAVARIIPDSTREELGAKAEDIIIGSFARRGKLKQQDAVCANPAAMKEIDALVEHLGDGFKDGSPITSITVIRSKMANAFTLPGGRLIILSGLLDMADSPNGFAAVLAHEMGHAEHRHPMRLMISNAGVAAGLSLLLGDISGGTFIAGFGQMMISSSYSRDFEREADKTAVALMKKAGYNIAPMIPLFRKLEGQNEGKGFGPSFLQSHPGMAERIETLTKAGHEGGPAMSPDDWANIRTMCKKPV